MKYRDLITITGATASGKTQLAVSLASLIDAEIISADSRQVYRGMNIGTGKDLKDYAVNGKQIKYHLIDIREPGYEYSVYEFCNDFNNIYADIISRGKKAILCGGTGMYIEAVLKQYNLEFAEKNTVLRNDLINKNLEELNQILLKLKPNLHNTTDTLDKERLIRAIEIELASKNANQNGVDFSAYKIYTINYDRQILRKRITERLTQRLKEGMIEEVKGLMDNGLTIEKLKYYGLEYKFISMYLNKEIDYAEMFSKLNTAIHQFAKRQMTWFRRMEKQGFKLIWIDGELSLDDKMNIILEK